MKELVKPISQEGKYQELLLSAMCSENDCTCSCIFGNTNGRNQCDAESEDEILF